MRGLAFVLCLVALMLALPTIGVGSSHIMSSKEEGSAAASCIAVFFAGVFSTIGEDK
jgi:hypothetical protein